MIKVYSEEQEKLHKSSARTIGKTILIPTP